MRIYAHKLMTVMVKCKGKRDIIHIDNVQWVGFFEHDTKEANGFTKGEEV